MRSFLHKFFADPIVGGLAFLGVLLVIYLAWHEVAERRERRAVEKRKRELNR
jgi:hypothetical protein